MNNYFNIKKMIESKREYKEQVRRIKAMPEDYQYVYQKVTESMWQFASGDGCDMLELQGSLTDLFEKGAAEGKNVLEITGEDVASFVDELLKSVNADTESWREKLNREIKEKLIK